MSAEGDSPSEPGGRSKGSGAGAFLPIGIVFLAFAVAMIFLGATAWIAFFSMGVTFLILGMQKPASRKDRRH
ncbi:hypothetical protein [Arthrobacter sp.]|uniref:hypothetical protein n=1 Tax=Arthrobacter sp. TaxID=1667 RepID=UPI003395AEE1